MIVESSLKWRRIEFEESKVRIHAIGSRNMKHIFRYSTQIWIHNSYGCQVVLIKIKWCSRFIFLESFVKRLYSANSRSSDTISMRYFYKGKDEKRNTDRYMKEVLTIVTEVEDLQSPCHGLSVCAVFWNLGIGKGIGIPLWKIVKSYLESQVSVSRGATAENIIDKPSR